MSVAVNYFGDYHYDMPLSELLSFSSLSSLRGLPRLGGRRVICMGRGRMQGRVICILLWMGRGVFLRWVGGRGSGGWSLIGAGGLPAVGVGGL